VILYLWTFATFASFRDVSGQLRLRQVLLNKPCDWCGNYISHHLYDTLKYGLAGPMKFLWIFQTLVNFFVKLGTFLMHTLQSPVSWNMFCVWYCSYLRHNLMANWRMVCLLVEGISSICSVLAVSAAAADPSPEFTSSSSSDAGGINYFVNDVLVTLLSWHPAAVPQVHSCCVCVHPIWLPE